MSEIINKKSVSENLDKFSPIFKKTDFIDPANLYPAAFYPE